MSFERNIYLIDTGEFCILVDPFMKKFYLIEGLKEKNAYLHNFLCPTFKEGIFKEGAWFDYTDEEISSIKYKDNRKITENMLIDFFTLKKYYQAGVVAIRDIKKAAASIYKKNRFMELINDLPLGEKNQLIPFTHFK